MAASNFRGSVNTTGIVRLLCDVDVSGKSQMVPLTGNKFEIKCIYMYVNACIHDINDISMATLYVIESINSSALWPNLPDETGNRASRMVTTKTGNT